MNYIHFASLGIVGVDFGLILKPLEQPLTNRHLPDYISVLPTEQAELLAFSQTPLAVMSFP